jgi:hypothetical protein
MTTIEENGDDGFGQTLDTGDRRGGDRDGCCAARIGAEDGARRGRDELL